MFRTRRTFDNALLDFVLKYILEDTSGELGSNILDFIITV